MTRGRGHFPVAHYGAAGNAADDIPEILQLHFAPVISASLAKKLFLRSVSSLQFTGGDW